MHGGQLHKTVILRSWHSRKLAGASCMLHARGFFALGTKRVFCCKDKCTIPYSILFY